MKFSYNFVKKFLDIDMNPEELANKLTLSGFEVEGSEEINGDTVLEIELTSDRPDMLSIAGVCSELSAQTGKQPTIKLSEIEDYVTEEGEMSVSIKDTNDCSFYSATVIKNVEVRESPKWMQVLLEANGIAVVNNLVDITNYCMLKWGEPMHAFDASTLEGGIVVRRAKEGENLECLDAKTRELKDEYLVIADEKKPIALAGIIGGESTKIESTTKDVILECALFDKVRVRYARKSLGINTDSSYRFERFVYPRYAQEALKEARELILEHAGGEIVQKIYAGEIKHLETSTIKLDIAQMNDYLGTEISQEEAADILESLTCDVSSDSSVLTVVTPADRQDLKIKQDLYEEIVRIWGFDRVPSRLPLIERKVLPEMLYDFKFKIAQVLRSLGFQECVTMNIDNENNKLLDQSKQPIIISNPLKAPENRMRTDIYPGLVRSIEHNVKQKQADCSFFEFAHVFSLIDSKDVERENMSIAVHVSDEIEFYEFKAKVEKLLGSIVAELETIDCKHDKFSGYRIYKVNGEELGFIGVLTKDICSDLDLDKVFIAEFDLEALFEKKSAPKYKKINRLPSALRDISLVSKRSVIFSDIEKVIKQTAGDIFKDMQVIDIYKGKKVEKGTTAFTLRIEYQHEDRTLESEEVDKLHFTLRDKLACLDGVTVR